MRSWNVRNAARVADWHREWFRSNREQALANAREWAQANPERKRVYERARQKRLDFRGWTGEDFRAAKQLTESACSYCGEPGPLTLDHVVPLARGGAHRIDNLAAACKPCNSWKGARDELEFRALLALEAVIDGRGGGVGEDEAPYRVAPPCRRPRHGHVRIRDMLVARRDARRMGLSRRIA